MHNLETTIGENGKLNASFVTVKQSAWHNLGIVVPNQLTSAEALKLAKMDWKVEKQPCILNINGDMETSEEQFYIRRTDKGGIESVLGYVKSGYTPLQNTESFEFFDNIVGAGEAFYETAGVLGKGERIFISAILPEHFNINVGKGDTDTAKPYIFLTNSHDGKGCVTAGLTYTRIVCQNTLNFALKNTVGNKVTLKHTKNMKEALKAAEQLMGITNLYKKELETVYNLMAKKAINENQWLTVVASAFTTSDKQLAAYLKGERGTDLVSTQLVNTIDAVKNYDNLNPTQQLKTTEGTVWGAVNAITGYFQNVETVAKNDSDKFSSILDGRIATMSQKAFDTALTFLN